MTVADSDEERLRNQIKELVTRRDYDAALRFAVREADHAYGLQRYAQGIDVLKALIQLLKDQQVVLWNIYIGAYQKIVGLDNQLGDKSATIRDLIELSRYCIKDGDFDKALAAGDSAVSIDARSTDALNQKARVLAYRRDYAQAYKVLDQSLGVSPQNPRTLYLKASILGDNGKFAEALTMFEQVRMSEPSYPGLGKAIAEMRRQIDWKVKTVDGPVSGMRASHSSELDRVPAIQRKAKSTDPDDTTRNTLETLYDEAVVAEPSGPVEQLSTAAKRVVPSEAAGLTVMSPEELRLASLRREQEPEAFTVPASPPLGQEAERQLIGMLRDISQGTMEREDLMQRLSNADSATIPLSLGVLYFNFLRSPQDAEAMSDLLTWLGHSGYTRLPLFGDGCRVEDTQGRIFARARGHRIVCTGGTGHGTSGRQVCFARGHRAPACSDHRAQSGRGCLYAGGPCHCYGTGCAGPVDRPRHRGREYGKGADAGGCDRRTAGAYGRR